MEEEKAVPKDKIKDYFSFIVETRLLVNFVLLEFFSVKAMKIKTFKIHLKTRVLHFRRLNF